MLITENKMDEWVRSNAHDAQGVIVELVSRLVAASCPKPKDKRFPLGDSIAQVGPDGILDVDTPFEPFVPAGRSYWAIGTGLKARDKATSDYKDLTRDTPEEIRKDSSFVFVTPLSGRRDWQHSWNESVQAKWLDDRNKMNDWKSVRVIDGTKLIDWLNKFAAVEHWLAIRMGMPAQQIDTPESRWGILRTIGEPPNLTPGIFLAHRQNACSKLAEVFDGRATRLKLETHFPEQIPDFVAAYIATLDNEIRMEISGRCLTISGLEAWNTICDQYENHILIASSAFNLYGNEGATLLEKARKAGHSVVYGGLPGGIPCENVASLQQPNVYQLETEFINAGFNEERARTLAQRSGGNLSSVLKLLQSLSLIPDWAQGPGSMNLGTAVLLGAWSDGHPADCKVAELLSAKSYADWIAVMREFVLRQSSPLVHQDGGWRFVVRYEGWYALGPQIFDDQLDRLKGVAVMVLKEKDPRFDLPSDQRFAANVYGKVLAHSESLRNGIAESLALLGSQPNALKSASFGKSEIVAAIAVREILHGAEWVQWASLNDVLPLLAEAAPNEFLSAIENALRRTPCPFDSLFSQEGSGITGANYMTGLLWALETLGWDPDHIVRVISILGALAARDPGGNWANRPSNSLTSILLPWYPQTCAPFAKRLIAVNTLLNERPDVGWRILLSLLPQSHSTSNGTRRPIWRTTIPDNWSKRVTRAEYWEQERAYSELATIAAISNIDWLVEIIDQLPTLHPTAYNVLLSYLESDVVLSLQEDNLMRLWSKLIDLVSRHRKFADSDWAMKSEQVERLEVLANRLAPQSPIIRHRRLFTESDFDLYDMKGDYQEQMRQLEDRRQQAVLEIKVVGGIQAVIHFAVTVQSRAHVGFSFGFVADDCDDITILPGMVDSKQNDLFQFAEGYVRGKFQKLGWDWIDTIVTTGWSSIQKGEFLSFLPFTSETWRRVNQILDDEEAQYWTTTAANPYETDKDLEIAVDKLIEHGRPRAALRCIHRGLSVNQLLDEAKTVTALLAAVDSPEVRSSLDDYETVEIIKALQNDAKVNPESLFGIEWAYLPQLEGNLNATPKVLGSRLASDPSFFCEVIRLVFRSNKEDHAKKEPTEKAERIASNAYRLLCQWKTPPGIQEAGGYSGTSLSSWLDAVKRECTDTGHLSVALLRIGYVLIYTPADPDGLWIHRSAAAALNAEDFMEMRNGFRIALFNSRGTHGVDPTGRPERELAAKYRIQAEEIEAAGFHRLSTVLKDLAEDYDREALRISAEMNDD